MVFMNVGVICWQMVEQFGEHWSIMEILLDGV